jgi:CcmD family protein
MLQRMWLACGSVVLMAAVLAAFQPPGGQSEFVPVNTLPVGDQLPAAPLLVAAYAFVWIATMFYIWTVWRRLSKVEREMRALEARQTRRNATS